MAGHPKAGKFPGELARHEGDTVQLVGLAPLLARHLGITVAD